MSELEVWLYDELIGRLRRTTTGLAFSYSTTWVERDGARLSLSLPVRAQPHEGGPVRAFFGNLLPEGEVRQHVARRFGVSVGNDFALLAALGGDCAGAVALFEPGFRPHARRGDGVRWLDEHELAQDLRELPTRPLLADPDDEIRLSLAGAQDKLPVVAGGGRFGLPLAGAPSTHILKPPIPRLDDTVFNEGFCLRLGAELGLDVAAAEIVEVSDLPVLVVTRYDREREGEKILRVHQEDLCQALGIASESKYEAEGGPGLAEVFGAVRGVTAAPVRDVLALVDAVALNFLLGNHDAHAKNFSLLYGRRGEAQLAPLYDIVSTAAYPALSRKAAMKLGGEYRPEYVRRRHIERFASETGLGGPAVRRRLLRWAAVVPDVAEDLSTEFRERGLHRPVIDRVLDVVDRRARHLTQELSPRRAGP